MIKKRAMIAACWLAFAWVCSAVCGCGAKGSADAGGSKYNLTSEPDFSKAGVGTDASSGLSGKEEPVGDFSLSFMRKAVAQAHAQGAENPVLSPASVYLALLLAAMGSGGETEAEFEAVLGLPADEWGRYGGRLMRFMNQSGGSERLTMANALWLDEGAQVEEAYLERVSGELYSEVFCLDLSSKEAQEAINEWVAKRTQGMIPAFRSEPYGDMIRLAILNAVSLEAEWEEAFEEMYTETRPFYREDGSEAAVQFLCDWPCHREYVQEEALEGVVLPYQSGRLAFLALRATDGRTPEELLAKLSAEQIRALAAGAVKTPMDFAMPRFTLEYEQELLGVLEEMGLSTALQPDQADFSVMAGTEGEPLYIADVAQKVKIQVDEEGTKAAAATEVAVGAGAAEETQLIELHFDSPFLYAVIERETGIVLFMGIMENPPAAE